MADCAEVFVAGDLHGNIGNFQRLLKAADLAPLDVAGFTAFVGAEFERWGAIARAAGLGRG